MTSPEEPVNVNAAAPKISQNAIARFFGVFGLVCVAGVVLGTLFATGTIGGSSSNASSQSVGGSSTNANEEVLGRLPSSAPSMAYIASTEPGSPTTAPKHSPTFTPTLTLTTRPTDSRTTMPTPLASFNPSQSARPSVRSSLRPSSTPSSAAPSLHPSSFPTVDTSMSPSQQELIKSFGFYVMGDIPYSSAEELVMEQQMLSMTKYRKNNSVFTIHVGDLWKVDLTNCGATTIDIVNATLASGPLPTFIVPGDNDYLDCSVPSTAFQTFLQWFVPFENLWMNRTLPGVPTLLDLNVARFYPNYSEMFAFVHLDVLFLSVHLMPTPPKDTTLQKTFPELKLANVDWAISSIENAYDNYDLRAVIMFSHSHISNETEYFFRQLSETFIANATRLLTPVLYIHGHGHHFKIIDRVAKDFQWPLFKALQVDRGGKADPLYIEIAPVVGGQMIPLVNVTGLQHVFYNGLILVDRQNGLYTNGTW